MLLDLRPDEHLEGADAVRRGLTNHCRRYEWPAQELREQVGCHLPSIEGSRREVPERGLSLGRLVDGQQVPVLGSRAAPELDQEGVIGGTPKETLQLDLGQAAESLLYGVGVK
jgi:hypothetical protein